MERRLLWLGSSQSDLRAFPSDARQRAGYELYQVQCGLDPSDWKPTSSVGAGVREIRVYTRLEHRVLYVARFDEGVYVLHAFQKKSGKTRMSDIEVARTRFKELRRTRNAGRSGETRDQGDC